MHPRLFRPPGRNADTPEVRAVGLKDVVDDFVQNPAASARALAKLLSFRRLRHLVKTPPTSSQDGLETPDLAIADGLRVAGGGDGGYSEIGAGVPLQTFRHDKRSEILRSSEPNPSRAKDKGVAGGIIE